MKAIRAMILSKRKFGFGFGFGYGLMHDSNLDKEPTRPPPERAGINGELGSNGWHLLERSFQRDCKPLSQGAALLEEFLLRGFGYSPLDVLSAKGKGEKP